MTIETLYQKLKTANYHISTDTRDIVPGSIFFAWKGGSYDGNDFAAEALKQGCSYVVMDNKEKSSFDERCIYVEDSIETLQKLAHHHRIQFDIPVLALTGSNGKTTTKELIAAALGTEKNIVASLGNLNNHVGVPKTLLMIRPETDIAIIEMGANHVGEIVTLCRLANPTHGLITNIGRAHIGLFGGFENIVRAKTELYRYLEHTDGMSFVNGDDALLLNEVNTKSKITYLSSGSDYPFTSGKTLPFVSGVWQSNLIQTQLTGEYNMQNIAAAIAIGDYFGISESAIIIAISEYKPDNQRSEIVETDNGNTIIKDYYNANRSSMELALENLANIKTDKEKVVILGDMFELGDYEQEDHMAIAEMAQNFDRVILVGKAFASLSILAENIEQYMTTDEAIFAKQKSPITNSYILLKASQGMNFKKLFNKINF